MRVLLTGSGGLVGAALAEALLPDHEVWGTHRSTPPPAGVRARRCELSTASDTAALVADLAPDVVVHAAYGRADLRRDVVAATRSVAAACAAAGAPLVALSTDAVFDGESAPYAEGDPPDPVWAYGRAKVLAEEVARAAVVDAAVVRLALVVHLDPRRPDPSTRRLLDSARTGEAVTCFTDEVRSVVRLADVVDGLRRLVEAPRERREGWWHLGGPQPMSRFELASATIARLGLADARVRPASAGTHSERRPRDVTLSSDRARVELGWVPEPAGSVTGHGSQRGRSPGAT